MTEETRQNPAAPDEVPASRETDALVPELVDDGPPVSERVQSTTVGTGSYVAVSCTAMAFLLTFVILGILFLFRWLG